MSCSPTLEKLVRNFFRAADLREPETFAQVLTPTVTWRFGNWPTLHGRAAVAAALTDFFQHAREMEHAIVGIWGTDDVVTVETRVTYLDAYARRHTYPGCDILFFEGDLIREVRIFVDNHEMFIPPAPNLA
jgi:hypothetical protein